MKFKMYKNLIKFEINKINQLLNLLKILIL